MIGAADDAAGTSEGEATNYGIESAQSGASVLNASIVASSPGTTHIVEDDLGAKARPRLSRIRRCAVRPRYHNNPVRVVAFNTLNTPESGDQARYDSERRLAGSNGTAPRPCCGR